MSNNNNKMEKCSGCKKPKPANCKTKTCNECKKRGAANRKGAKKIQKKCCAIKQDGSKCTNKVNEKYGNKFCGKHMVEWKEYIQADGKEVKRCNSRTQCDPNNPGIKAILPKNYTNKKCEKCLEHEREKDHEHRDKINKTNEKMTDSFLCIKCSKQFPLSEASQTSLGDKSFYCSHCFKQRQKVEKNRERSDRKDYYKKYESRPETKALRIKWRQENPGKIYGYYTGYRARKLNEDPVEYHKKCAEYARMWREKNPEKAKEIWLRYRTNPNIAYSLHLRQSNIRGYDSELSFEEFAEMIDCKCYYCDIERGKFLNNIDRLDNSKGYTKGNMVTCCKTCNMMKNTLNEVTFILMCAHITHTNRFFKYGLYPQVFNNYMGTGYESYKKKSIKRKLLFELTKEQYDNFRSSSCYICTRKSDDNHTNGIDRYDSSKGYIIDNCRTCCADCNYMKKNLSHDDFLYQCAFIADTHKERLRDLLKIWTPSKFQEINKNKKRLTEEEKKKISDGKGKIRHEKTMSTKTKEAIEKKQYEIKNRKNC